MAQHSKSVSTFSDNVSQNNLRKRKTSQVHTTASSASALNQNATQLRNQLPFYDFSQVVDRPARVKAQGSLLPQVVNNNIKDLLNTNFQEDLDYLENDEFVPNPIKKYLKVKVKDINSFNKIISSLKPPKQSKKNAKALDKVKLAVAQQQKNIYAFLPTVTINMSSKCNITSNTSQPQTNVCLGQQQEACSDLFNLQVSTDISEELNSEERQAGESLQNSVCQDSHENLHTPLKHQNIPRLLSFASTVDSNYCQEADDTHRSNLVVGTQIQLLQRIDQNSQFDSKVGKEMGKRNIACKLFEDEEEADYFFGSTERLEENLLTEENKFCDLVVNKPRCRRGSDDISRLFRETQMEDIPVPLLNKDCFIDYDHSFNQVPYPHFGSISLFNDFE